MVCVAPEAVFQREEGGGRREERIRMRMRRRRRGGGGERRGESGDGESGDGERGQLATTNVQNGLVFFFFCSFSKTLNFKKSPGGKF